MKKLDTTERLVLLLTPETMKSLEELAAAQNKPASTYAREMLVVIVSDQILNREKGLRDTYYTPEHIADMASGSGGFMKQAFDLTQNPPYTGKEKTE
jgi:hypothetical protein